MTNRRTVIVAPTLAEAQAEADELALSPRNVLLVSNSSTARLRGHELTEDDLVRIREEAWSGDLVTNVDLCLRWSSRSSS